MNLPSALDNNPTLRQSLANFDLADLSIQAAYNALNPTLDPTLTELYVSTRRRAYGERGTEATLTIPLRKFGQVGWDARSVELARNQAGQDLRTAVQMLLQQVAEGFVQASVNEALVEISELRVKDRQAYLQ